LTQAELQQLAQDDTGRVVALVVTKQAEEGELLMGGGRFVFESADAPQSASFAFLTDAFSLGCNGAGLEKST
jgi:hypothetical protein